MLFRSVDNALSYTVLIGDKTFTNATSPFYLNQSGISLTSNYEVAVKAIGNGTSYLDSEMSSKVMFTRTIKDLFISEYIEGSVGNSKAIEIYNGTNASITLTNNYKLCLFTNGATSCTSIALTGTIASGSTFVISHSSAHADILAKAQQKTGSLAFNGDDAVALVKVSDDSYVDIFGKIGEDPGTGWPASTPITLDKTLVRNSNIYYGITVNPTTFNPASQWTVYNELSGGIPNTSNLGSHSISVLPIILIPE